MAHNKKLGSIITPHGLHPEAHELATVDVFTALGKNVAFLAPNRNKNSKTPDVIMDGIRWEMKSPTCNSKTTISNTLKRAVRQSSCIILDTRRTKLPDKSIQYEIERNLPLAKSISKVIMITKTKKIIEINRH